LFIYHFLSIILAVCSIFLGFIILKKKNKKKVNTIFVIISILCAFWILSIQATTIEMSSFIARSPFLIGSIIAFVLVLFSYYFPVEKKLNNLTILLLSIPMLFFCVITIGTDLIIKELIISEMDLTFIKGAGYPYFSVYFLLYCVLTIKNIISGYNYLSPNKKKKVLIFVVGFFTSLVLATTTNLILPILGVSVLYEYGGLATIFFLLFTFYAISKHNLMNIELIITRIFSYGVIFICISLSLLIINYISPNRLIFLVASIAVCFLWMIHGGKLREKIQTSTEKKWVSDWYDSHVVINDISDVLANSFNRESIFKGVSSSINNIIEIKDYFIITAHTDKNGEINKYILAKKESEEVEEISINHPLINYFKENENIASLKEVQSKIEEPIKLFDNKDYIYIPFHSPETLDGIIVLGERLSEAKYNDKDYKLFKVVSLLVRVYLERMKPYEKIKKSYQHSLKMAEKMSRNASYTTLVTGIAHEIWNPLSSVQMAIDIIKNECPGKESLFRAVELASSNINRVINISKTMTKYGDPDSQKLESINLIEIIMDLLLILEIENKNKQVKINTYYSDDIVKIFGNKNMLYYLFSCVILNAFEAIEEKGIINIRIEKTSYFNENEKQEDGVCIEISDTGKGITKIDIQKIFDPFYTTKYTHIGLGLSSVLQIIKEHNGMILADSKVNRGTNIKIYLPFQNSALELNI
jgi:signal transduction histidine kinase